jgi:hypothetical protein
VEVAVEEMRVLMEELLIMVEQDKVENILEFKEEQEQIIQEVVQEVVVIVKILK